MEDSVKDNENVTKNSNKKFLLIGLIVLLFFVGVGLGFVTCNLLSDDSSSEKKVIVKECDKKEEIDDVVSDNDDEIETDEEDDDFADDEIEEEPEKEIFEYGKVTVTGFVTIGKMSSFDCFENCETVDYLFFHVMETEDESFLNFLEDRAGNSFVLGNAIGLGCVNNGVLSYYNSSDALGGKHFSLSKDNTKKLLDSSRYNMVTLELERKEFSGGSEAPLCYSHITTINFK